jgi:hypothetical protein
MQVFLCLMPASMLHVPSGCRPLLFSSLGAPPPAAARSRAGRRGQRFEHAHCRPPPRPAEHLHPRRTLPPSPLPRPRCGCALSLLCKPTTVRQHLRAPAMHPPPCAGSSTSRRLASPPAAYGPRNVRGAVILSSSRAAGCVASSSAAFLPGPLCPRGVACAAPRGVQDRARACADSAPLGAGPAPAGWIWIDSCSPSRTPKKAARQSPAAGTRSSQVCTRASSLDRPRRWGPRRAPIGATGVAGPHIM